jgi:uncharacterized NAD(P)/FAD-binding protein YdhS
MTESNDMLSQFKPRIAIIGAGFCGTAVAVQLLRRATSPMHIVMLNRSGNVARGLAYGTRSPQHVLNVPAGRMSLFADETNDFLQYLQQQDAAFRGGDFVSRSLYGDYLAQRLRDAIEQSTHASFTQQSAEACDLLPAVDGRIDIRLKDGSALTADRVIFALGNYAPATPASLKPIVDSPSYIADPWSNGALANIDPDKPVVLLGTGLTMFDVALELTRQGQRAPILAISRRGLMPQTHRDHYHSIAGDLTPPGIESAVGTRTMLRRFRKQQRELGTNEVDWRDIIAALRPITPSLWQKLSTGQRAQFLRHLQPYWDTHRHRCAPSIGHAIEQLVDTQQLKVSAGRILNTSSHGQDIKLTVRWRGAETGRIDAGYLINCTGPAAYVPAIEDTLLSTMLAKGFAMTDMLGLGLVTHPNYCLAGKAPWPIYHVGPLLKGQHWESTAVPELREHAARLVSSLLHDINTMQISKEHIRV